MRNFASTMSWSAILAGILLFAASSVHAQATRTWVSGVGDDVNPCSRTAPCKTFAGAISKTATNGEINCLDPAGFGTVTITKSITIDCKHTLGSVLNASVNGVNIPFDNFTDARKTVRLRGLAFNGADTGVIGVRITGNTNTAGSEVYIEDTVIDGNFGGSSTTGQRGISDERNNGGKLFVSNTTIRNMGVYGMLVMPSLNGPATIDVVIDNVRVLNSGYGGVFSIAVRAMVVRSVFSGNANAGLYVEGSGQLNVSESVMSNNGIGIQTVNSTARLAGNDISFNGTGITGATSSFGTNRISGNTSPGIAPTLLSPALQ